MLLDLDNGEGGSDLAADVCIAGAGAAGVTLARALSRQGVDVLLLESGGRDYSAAAQDLAEGEVAQPGFPYYALRESRLRFFGGTTAVWGGRVAELDAIDFERRSHVPHSGWPITHADLLPWLKAAYESLGLSRIASPEQGWRRLGKSGSPVDPAKLEPGFWQFDERADRFTLRHAADLVADPKVRIVLHATVIAIDLADDGQSVSAFRLRSQRGRSASARGRYFVLATGGIEAPRLVLASRLTTTGCAARGFGGDAVGRYFMEHPHARGGRLAPEPGPGAAWRALSLLPRHARHRGIRHAAVLRPSAETQRRDGILNSALGLALRAPETKGAGLGRQAYAALRHNLPSSGPWRRAWRFARRSAAIWRRLSDPAVTDLVTSIGGREISLSVRAEQAPNPVSRITLSPDRRDALGVALPVLDWRLTALDRDSVARLVTLFGEECARLGIGRVEPSTWLRSGKIWHFDPGIGNHAIGGYHHMGTLRMGLDPRESVVDGDCRFHDIANLYVAGSAVFPTVGWANPTLNIIALALRLADRLTGLIARDTAAPRRPGERPAPSIRHQHELTGRSET
ncbi:MAG: GMC family oxidoreductase [Pseudomonadota bacterium]